MQKTLTRHDMTVQKPVTTCPDRPRTCRQGSLPFKDVPQQDMAVQGPAATGPQRPGTCRDNTCRERRLPFMNLPRQNLTAQVPAAKEPHSPRTCRDRISPTKVMLQQQTKPDLLRIVSEHRQPHSGAHWMGVQKSQKKGMAQLGQLSFRMAEC
ncbi:hypothetical protein IscW_ISCW013880 [Ixodes scapularis]|uniref:Uncharacterized protein n=1 Tax=Ixodes scapularis TaxID=6945 RepID=B7QI89_IXOSC|nr:hypothetical protein IscW_ISCW013880 [Ixodes scapularis]|eukprot:XP_002414896.1 hypothetical protein IscW_ISCW013880 [Ixodes scapularis]